jgi:hypothetical protein
MSKEEPKQLSGFDNFKLPFGKGFDGKNFWVKLAQVIPWKELEEENTQFFPQRGRGAPKKPFRMALGAVLIKKGKEKGKTSDEKVVQEIQKDPHLQYFIGLEGYSAEKQFDATSMANFQDRLDPDLINRVYKQFMMDNEQETVQNGGEGGGKKGEKPHSNYGSTNDKLTKDHYERYIAFTEKNKYGQDLLAGKLDINQTKYSRLKKYHGFTYDHLHIIIEAIRGDKKESIRAILAEHHASRLRDEWKELSRAGLLLPLQSKINLNMASVMLLKRYFALCFLEDGHNDLSIEMLDDFDKQTTDYYEGFLSASVYMLCCIIEDIYDHDGVIQSAGFYQSVLLSAVKWIGSFNKTQGQTALDYNNATEFNVPWDFYEIEWSSNLQDLKNELARYCPPEQTESFYLGWNCFCVLFSSKIEFIFNSTENDPSFSITKVKNVVSDLLDYCLDKYLDNYYHDKIFKDWKLVYKFLTDNKLGYKEIKKKDNKDFPINSLISLYCDHNDTIESIKIINCFKDKMKGSRVAVAILFSKKQWYKPEHTNLVNILERKYSADTVMKNLSDYFKNEETALRQATKFKIDTFSIIELNTFSSYIKLAKENLIKFQKDNTKKISGTRQTEIEKLLDELSNRHDRSIDKQLVELGQKYDIPLEKLPSRIVFRKEFSALFIKYSWYKTSLIFFKKYGLYLEDINFFMRHDPHWDKSTNEKYAKRFFDESKKLEETRMKGKTLPPGLFDRGESFENEEKFWGFIQSHEEAIDYFYDDCEAMRAEFLKLFLKIDKLAL